MYKVLAPIWNGRCTEETRDEYLLQCKAAKIDCVLLAGDDTQSANEETFSLLKENIEFFEKAGIEAAVWVGSTIGHGPLENSFEDTKAWRFTRLTSLNGTPIDDVFCPLDKGFVEAVKNYVRKVATLGAKTIFLDDDFRMSQHGDGLCCCCDLHLKAMSEFAGEEVTIEKLREFAFKGGRNKYRDAWLKAQGDGLRSFARALREAVDEVAPSVRLSLCTAWSLWDVDGADGLEITKILAGKNKPILRLHGAPYWAKYGKSLGETIEVARMFAYLAGDEAETFHEGDVYPRPRYKIPAAYLELYDAATRADGKADGLFKYMFDYVNEPTYERGYVEKHVRETEKREQLTKVFSDGVADGVRVRVFAHTLENAVLPQDFHPDFLNQSPYACGNMISECSIPTTYEGDGLCDFIEGENARRIDPADLKNGAILDATAALILQEKGVDLGIRRVCSYKGEYVTHEDFTMGECVGLGQTIRLLRAEYDPAIVVKSEANGAPLTILYENKDGLKFYIYCCALRESQGVSPFKNSYARSRDLKRAIEWIAGRKVPAHISKCPELYVICKRKKNSLAVALFNCFPDEIYQPNVQLDKKYARVEVYGGKGVLVGETLALQDTIPAYGYTFFEVFEE